MTTALTDCPICETGVLNDQLRCSDCTVQLSGRPGEPQSDWVPIAYEPHNKPVVLLWAKVNPAYIDMWRSAFNRVNNIDCDYANQDGH